jgi:hypothetical protein
MPFQANPLPGGQTGADTLSIGGNAVAPGVGVAVATLAAPPAGVYEVRVSAQTGAGTLAADNGNMQLKKGAAAVVAALPTGGQEQIVDRVTLDGATALTVNAVAAATAGVPYTARISATRVE